MPLRSELGQIQLAQRALGLSAAAHTHSAVFSIFPISRQVNSPRALAHLCWKPWWQAKEQDPQQPKQAAEPFAAIRLLGIGRVNNAVLGLCPKPPNCILCRQRRPSPVPPALLVSVAWRHQQPWLWECRSCSCPRGLNLCLWQDLMPASSEKSFRKSVQAIRGWTASKETFSLTLISS